MTSEAIIYMIIFLYGIVIGSFLNVCIYRIPKKENIVMVRSHCMSCGYVLRWYDLVPLFSYLLLRGRCRKCRTKISVQYPMIEVLNGILYVALFSICDFNWVTILYCLMASALIVLSIIDFRTYEIPLGINIFILVLGLIRLALDFKSPMPYIAGFFAISVFLELILIISKGRAIGGGDVKLMAVCGLLIGWKLIILAFVAACILGSIIHLARMKISKADHVLALGPYLSLGIILAVLWGDKFINWYINLLI